MTDAHVLDASSPARVTFLDRLGAPFESTFRPQEALTVQVLAGAARSVRALRPQFVIQGGDVIDNDQSNELAHALAVLNGGPSIRGAVPTVTSACSSPTNPDPFYYRPDVDAPRHPGLLRAATRTFTSPGLGAPSYPVLGDHDVLVAGEDRADGVDPEPGRRRQGAVGAAGRLDAAAGCRARCGQRRPMGRRIRGWSIRS